MELNIDAEDAVSLETKSNPPLRFFKYGRSYEFYGRLGRTFTRFLGKEGTAYTWRLQGFTKIKTDNPGKEEMQKIDVTFPTLEDAVKYRWGQEFYATVPEERQMELRDDKILLTVNLEPGIVPEGYEPITETTVRKKANEDMAALIAKSVANRLGTPKMIIILAILGGAGIMAIVSKLFGWW
jgi:hypothetical protein